MNKIIKYCIILKCFSRFILLISIVLFQSCHQQEIPLHISEAIKKAGSNQEELRALISHYARNAEDSMKLKAAYFIVENLDGLVTLDTNSTRVNEIYFDLLDSSWDNDGRIMFSQATRAIDSLNKKFNINPSTPSIRYVYEIKTITAEFLISNIENAFYVWENMPWAKSVSFNDFCEYILPYRCTDTYATGAREFFLRKQRAILDSAKGSEDPFKAGAFIVKDVDYWFKEDVDLLKRFPYLHPIKFSDLLKGKMGPCIDANSVRVTALRSLGVPAALDEIPNWGNNNSPHFWYRIIDSAHDTVKMLITNENFNRKTQHIISASSYDAAVSEGAPSHIHVTYNRSVPKVYRRCFSKQPGSLGVIKSPEDTVPEYFNNTRLKDVTDEYLDAVDVSIRLNNTVSLHKFVYLCIFDNQKWKPVAWSAVTGDTAIFKNMGKNILYLPAYFYRGEFVPAAEPFVLGQDGVLKKIVREQKTEKVKLYTKYPLRTYVLNYASYMLGGRFQFANAKDFSDSITVHTVKSIPFYMTEIKVNATGAYRYLLYQFKGVPKTYISELEFYGLTNDGKEVKLSGKLIGNPGVYPYLAEKINDSIRYNLFKAADSTYTYIGLDLGQDNAATVTRIRFMPYGDDNGVVTGDTYELLYWDGKWISAGRQIAGPGNAVSFEAVPEGALLWLKNTSGGTQERLFICKKGRQQFW